MLESDEKTKLAEFLIEIKYKYNLNITSVEARQIAESLIDKGYRPCLVVKSELLNEIKDTIKRRVAEKELGREYLTEYGNGYIEGMVDTAVAIDVIFGGRGKDEDAQ